MRSRAGRRVGERLRSGSSSRYIEMIIDGSATSGNASFGGYYQGDAAYRSQRS
jgi:hypothetical protein